MRVAIVGCGRAGRALGLAIAGRRGRLRLSGFLSRSPRRAALLARAAGRSRAFRSRSDLIRASDVILLCVPDGAIATVAEALAGEPGLRGLILLHASGAIGTEPLGPARRVGASVGLLHPLAPLPPRGTRPPDLDGAWFAIGGQRRASAAARRIVAHLRGREIRVPDSARGAYHLAATIVANHATILAALALDFLGMHERMRGPTVRAAFADLLRRSAVAVGELGPVRALTGPASRADLVTLSRHLDLLSSAPPSLRSIYRLLSIAGVDLARRRGDLEEGPARRARRLLERGRRGH